MFTEAARVFQGGRCDWAKVLEKAMATQMVAIKDKGQKLYTCAPVWQELYKKRPEEPRRRGPGSQRCKERQKSNQ